MFERLRNRTPWTPLRWRGRFVARGVTIESAGDLGPRSRGAAFEPADGDPAAYGKRADVRRPGI